MVKKAEKKAPTVPESVLKRRKRDEDWAAKKAAAATDAKKKARDQRKDIFKRAESYVKEYRDQVRPANYGSGYIGLFCFPCDTSHQPSVLYLMSTFMLATRWRIPQTVLLITYTGCGSFAPTYNWLLGGWPIPALDAYDLCWGCCMMGLLACLIMSFLQSWGWPGAYRVPRASS